MGFLKRRPDLVFMKLIEEELKECLSTPSHTGDREARHMSVFALSLLLLCQSHQYQQDGQTYKHGKSKSFY